MILYHGTTKTNKNNILKKGFKFCKYGVYFTPRMDEALMYAKNKAEYDSDIPDLITIDTTEWVLMTNDEYDGVNGENSERLSRIRRYKIADYVHTDVRAMYYMVLNFEKLNRAVK